MELWPGGPRIRQHQQAQPVSHASVALQQAALDIFGPDPRRVLDLGSGCGIVALMLALRRPLWQVEGLEVQAELNHLACGNAALCRVNIPFHSGDMRSFTASLPYDLIVSNPPWLPPGSGKTSPIQTRNLSRFELLGGLADVLACVKRNLAPAGQALLLYPRSRSGELGKAADKTFLDIISLFPASGLQEHIICHIRHKGQ